MGAKRSSDVHDLIALGKSIFFPGGMSFFGKIEDMTSTLGNFKGDQISFANFTLARYITSNALTTETQSCERFLNWIGSQSKLMPRKKVMLMPTMVC